MTLFEVERGSSLWPYVRDFDTYDRNSGLGGTDAAAIMGLHPYKTAMGVYLAKQGRGSDFVESEAAEMGLLFEPVLADRYYRKRGHSADERGLKMITPGTLIHPEMPWVFGSPDRMIVDSDGCWLWGLEVKTAGLRKEREWGESGSKKMPQEYLIQCVWYMWITRALCRVAGWKEIPHWDVAVCIGGQDNRYYRVLHDQALEDAIIENADEFWRDCILLDNHPDAEPRDQSTLHRLWPQDDGFEIQADEPQQALVLELFQTSQQIKTLTGKEDAIKAAIKIIMGGATSIVGDGFRITWKTNKPSKKVDYRGLVSSLDLTQDMIGAYTTHGAAQRPFKPRFDKDYNHSSTSCDEGE